MRFKILTAEPTRRRPQGRPNRRWESNVKMEVKEIAVTTRNLIDSPQDRDYWRPLMNAVLNLWVP